MLSELFQGCLLFKGVDQMIKIYLEMNGNSITGWGSQLNDAPFVMIEENHDFFTNITNYILDGDGNLVKRDE